MSTSKRIEAIDLLRGVALFGILPVNITHFAMPYSYLNPTVFRGDEGGNQLTHAFVHVLVEQKAMAIFSILFGASTLLLCSKLEREQRRPSLAYLSRSGWLFLFGAVHFIFISITDILCFYSVCAIILFFFRRLRPAWSFICGVVIFMMPIPVWAGVVTTVRSSDVEAEHMLQDWWRPNEARIRANLNLFRGDYTEQLAARLGRTDDSVASHAAVQLAAMAVHLEFFSRSLGMMFIGMAFYRWGLLTSGVSRRVYWRILLFGVGFGVPVACYSLHQHYAHDWKWHYSLFPGRGLDQIATVCLAFGYTSAIMLWSTNGFAAGIRARFGAFGRMALTNYIGQSVLATSVFYGFGLGWYGYLSRLEQLFVVLAIWVIQFLWSSWWLARFKLGPLEWIWRTCSYWKSVPSRAR